MKSNNVFFFCILAIPHLQRKYPNRQHKRTQDFSLWDGGRGSECKNPKKTKNVEILLTFYTLRAIFRLFYYQHDLSEGFGVTTFLTEVTTNISNSIKRNAVDAQFPLHKFEAFDIVLHPNGDILNFILHASEQEQQLSYEDFIRLNCKHLKRMDTGLHYV